MADKKISQLNPASVVNAADLMVLVQSGQTLKVDADTFLKNLPTRPVVKEASESPASGHRCSRETEW